MDFKVMLWNMENFGNLESDWYVYMNNDTEMAKLTGFIHEENPDLIVITEVYAKDSYEYLGQISRLMVMKKHERDKHTNTINEAKKKPEEVRRSGREAVRRLMEQLNPRKKSGKTLDIIFASNIIPTSKGKEYSWCYSVKAFQKSKNNNRNERYAVIFNTQKFETLERELNESPIHSYTDEKGTNRRKNKENDKYRLIEISRDEQEDLKNFRLPGFLHLKLKNVKDDPVLQLCIWHAKPPYIDYDYLGKRDDIDDFVKHVQKQQQQKDGKTTSNPIASTTSSSKSINRYGSKKNRKKETPVPVNSIKQKWDPLKPFLVLGDFNSKDLAGLEGKMKGLQLSRVKFTKKYANAKQGISTVKKLIPKSKDEVSEDESTMKLTGDNKHAPFDNIFHNAQLQLVPGSQYVVESDFSDHYPVFATFSYNP